MGTPVPPSFLPYLEALPPKFFDCEQEYFIIAQRETPSGVVPEGVSDADRKRKATRRP